MGKEAPGRGVRFQEGAPQNPLYRMRRNEGQRRATRRVPSVETWLIMEYCNRGAFGLVCRLSCCLNVLKFLLITMHGVHGVHGC